MSFEDDDATQSPRRLWVKSDRAKISILQIFRTAFDDRQADATAPPSATGPRRIRVREGVTEATLRAQINADLTALMSTIRLSSAVDLDDAPHVARSVLNYGFRDLSDLSETRLKSPEVIEQLRQSLIDHEPRLVPETIRVRVKRTEGATDRRLSLFVEAELVGDPVDIPVDFDAEVDLGAGKLRMTDLRVTL